jgi:hypothetical protein
MGDLISKNACTNLATKVVHLSMRKKPRDMLCTAEGIMISYVRPNSQRVYILFNTTLNTLIANTSQTILHAEVVKPFSC